MRRMKANELKAYEQLSKLTQPEVHKFMLRFLRKYYDKVIFTKDYICAEGDIPIALVAHMDTVHKSRVREFFYDQQKNVVWSPQGLGADDRAGVFLIISIIKAGLKPHIILTTDEEKGGLGAFALAQTPCPFSQLKYMIELDRANSNDCVFYDVYSPQFFDYVESFGFVEDFGSFSDICYLSAGWKIVSVNLSVGYHNEHTLGEYLNLSQMFSTLEKVQNMLKQTTIPDFTYAERTAYTSMITDFPSDWENYYYTTASYEHCDHCGKACEPYDLTPVKGIRNKKKYFCPDCLSIADWCEICGKAYEPIDNTRMNKDICPECEEKIRSELKNDR